MNVNIKKIYKIEIAAIVFMLVAFVVLDAIPRLSEIFSLWQRMLSAQKTAASLSETEKGKIHQELVSERQHLEAGFQTMRQIVSTVEQKMSGEKDIPKMTLKLEEFASASGINLLSIKPTTTGSKGGHESVTIALEIECEYAQLVKFLSQWDSTQFYIAVQEMTVTSSGAMTGKLAVHLTINVFFKSSQVPG